MDAYSFSEMVSNVEQDWKKITVHTGDNNWEEIVDLVFCPECDQYHIISERVPFKEG